jgi:hypothetical protein
MNAASPYAGTPPVTLEALMLREQMINFLQATVIFLLITNAFTITAAICAIRLLTGAPLEKRQAAGGIARRLELMFPAKS